MGKKHTTNAQKNSVHQKTLNHIIPSTSYRKIINAQGQQKCKQANISLFIGPNKDHDR